MADEDKNSTGVLDAEGVEEGPNGQGGAKPTGAQPGRLPPIYIGTRFAGGVKISRVVVDGRQINAANKRVKVKAGSFVEIYGENLSNYDSVAFRIAGGVYTPLNLNILSTEIKFTVPNYEEMLSTGADIELEFLSIFNPAFNGRLNNKLTYRTNQQQEEDKTQKNKESQEEYEKSQLQQGQTSGPASLILDAGGGVMGGIAGAVAGQSSAATEPNKKASGGKPQANQQALKKPSANDDFDGDSEEAEAGENSFTENKVIGSTAEVSAGGQTISQANLGQKVSGAVEAAKNINVAASGGRSASVGAKNQTQAFVGGKTGVGKVSGTTKVTGQTQGVGGLGVSGRVSGQTSGQTRGSVNIESSQSVSGGGSLNTPSGGTTQAVQGSESVTIKDSGVIQSQAGVETSGGSKQTVSSQAQGNINVKANVSGAETGGATVGALPQKGGEASSKDSVSGSGGIKVETEIAGSQEVPGTVPKKEKNLNQPVEGAEKNISSSSKKPPAALGANLKPPAGLGAMKTLGVNLNKTLGKPVATRPVPGGSQSPAQATLEENKESTAEQAEPSAPHEAADKKPEVGSNLPERQSSPDNQFQKKSGAESKGSPVLPGKPISPLRSQVEPRQDQSVAGQKPSNLSQGPQPGGENFRMPEGSQEQEGNNGDENQTASEPDRREQGQDEESGSEGQNQNEEEAPEQEGGDLGNALQGAKEGAGLGKNFGPEGAAIGAAVGAAASTEDGQEIIGQTTSKLWWWGFGFSSTTFFLGLDFLAGAVIMNVYWWRHRKTPKLFPMKTWQKFITVFATVFPFIAIIFLITLFMAIGCNYPSKTLGYRFTVVGAFIGDDCKYFDVTNLPTSSQNTAPATQAPPSQGAQGINPRGPSP